MLSCRKNGRRFLDDSLVECPSSHFMSNQEVFCFVAMTINDGDFSFFIRLSLASVHGNSTAVVVDDDLVVDAIVDNDHREPKFGSTDL